MCLQWVAIGFWHEADVDIEQLIVSRAKLAWVLGLSGSRITQLVEERVIPAPEAHGKYKPSASVRAYCRYSRDIGGERSKGATDFASALVQWMQSKARRAAIEERAAGSEFIPVTTMIQGWEANKRGASNSLPRRAEYRHQLGPNWQLLFEAGAKRIGQHDRSQPRTLAHRLITI